jgi:circadian clock protein KaiC
VARSLGWDLAALEADGRLLIRYASPVELSPDRFLYQVRREAAAFGARRVVLDSLSGMALGIVSERRLRELIYALGKYCRAAGITLLMTMEVPELFGAARLTGHGVSSVADNVVRLRYVETTGRLERAISVLKARGVAHETALRRCRIGPGGMRVEGDFAALRGVLTGVPQPEAGPAGAGWTAAT